MKKNYILKGLICALIMLGMNIFSFSQNTIAGWCMNGQSNWGTNPLAVTISDDNVLVGDLTKHNFGSNGTAANNAWGGTGFDGNTSTGGNVYAFFTIAPTTGYAISFSSIKLNYRRSAQGPTNALFQYSLDDVTYTTIATVEYSGTNATAGNPVDLTSISNLNQVLGTVYFRFIPYGANSANGTWYIPYVAASQYDLDVKGEVNPSGTNNVATPTISPNGGTFYTPQTVTISCATEGATIRYTLDGSEPTESLPPHSSPVTITISTTTTLKAKAWKTGMTTSSTRTANFTFPTIETLANIAAFKATPQSATIYKITGDVTFVYRTGRYMYIKDATGGLVIFDSSTPTITTEYVNGDVIKGGVVGKHTIYNGLHELEPAANTAAGIPGSTVTPKVITMSELLSNFATYESQLINIKNVTFDEGTFGTGAAANINMYQEDDMMTCRNHYGNITGYVTIPDKFYDVTGFPIPYNDDKQLAPRNEDDIVLAGSTVSTPVFSPEGGNFSEPVQVTISTTTDGAKIYYTTDGSEPTETSTLFTTPITISKTTTLKARGFHPDLSPSIIVSATYKFPNPDQVATPTFSPQGGTFTTNVEVILNCATAGATIYYTLNGNDPTEQDMLFETPIEMPDGTTVLKAKAFKTGMEPSDVATASYVVEVGIDECETQIKIYPNPTTGELHIQSSKFKVQSVEIFDISGRKVGAQFPSNVLEGWQPQADGVVIDLTVLQAGVYFVNINTEMGKIVKKIVKQ